MNTSYKLPTKEFSVKLSIAWLINNCMIDKNDQSVLTFVGYLKTEFPYKPFYIYSTLKIPSIRMTCILEESSDIILNNFLVS